MSEIMWTRGPWHCEADMRPLELVGGELHPTEEYCAGWNVRSAMYEVVGIEGIIWSGKADAQLIAAAPDLYEALHEICECLKDGDDFDASLIAQNAGYKALKKARGET